MRELCSPVPEEYWRGLEADTYPEEFVRALTENGWLAALVPEEYGGAGLSLTAASVILEEINASGGSSGACHAQMYDGHDPAARLGAAEAPLSAAHRLGRGSGCRPSA